MRLTKRKLALLCVFEDAEKPLTIKEAWERSQIVSMSLSSAYRIITDLYEGGKLNQLPVQGASPVWVAVTKSSHYFICKCCGECYTIDSPPILNLSAQATGFQIKHQLHTYTGICPDCP